MLVVAIPLIPVKSDLRNGGLQVRKVRVKGCALVGLSPMGDDRGTLIAIEAGRQIPFGVKRVYYVFDTKPGVSRGFHAHHALRQFLVAVSGSCTLALDDGNSRDEVLLDNPALGLQIDGLVWREMRDFSPNCVLMVLADAPYDETDYIRDYDEFVAAAEARVA